MPWIGPDARNALFYDSVADMKLGKNFDGSTVITNGYYKPNDGGGGTYIVRTKKTTDIDDGGSIHFLMDDLVAELIVGDYVTPEQFGAYGDGEHDDTNAIQKSVNYCVWKKIDIQFCLNYFVRNEKIVVDGKCKLFGLGKIIKQPVEYSEESSNRKDGSIFLVTGNNVVIDGLSFESTKKYTPSLDVINLHTTDEKASNTSAITAMDCSYLTIRNIKTKNMNPVSLIRVKKCSVNDSFFVFAENGIYSDESNAVVSNCLFSMDNLKSVYYHALYIKNGSDVISNHCKFYVEGDDFYYGPLFAERSDDGIDKKNIVVIDSFDVNANCKRLYLAHDSELFLLKNGTYINNRADSIEDDIGKSYSSGCSKVEICNCHFNVDCGYFDTDGVVTTIKDCEIIVHNFNSSSLFTGGNISLMNCLIDIAIMGNGFVVRPSLKTTLIGCKVRIGKGALRFNSPNSLEMFIVNGCIFERDDTSNNSGYIFYSNDFSLYRVANNLFCGKIQKIYDESKPNVDNSFVNNIVN